MGPGVPDVRGGDVSRTLALAAPDEDASEASAVTATDDQTRTLTEGAAIAAPQGQPEPLELERGATVGRFVVLERVGAGATATVYAAWDPQLSRRVALKVLRANSDVTERLRTLREARALAQLSHPNVVRVFDLGDVDGLPFIAMELVEGSSLRELLKTPLPEARRLALFEQAGRGLAAVHGLGIVHRDIKSRNVMVAVDNRALLIDFGLACDVERDGEEWLSRTVGTKKYRPPEMRDGRRAHCSLDVYCFGLVLEKLVRQRRDRTSSDDSHARSHRDLPRKDADSGRHERHDCRLLTDLARQCTSERPHERPTAWTLLQRLQRHCGESVSRCDSARERVPLHDALHACRERERSASAIAKQSGSAEDEQRERKRRRLDDGRISGMRVADGGSEIDKEE